MARARPLFLKLLALPLLAACGPEQPGDAGHQAIALANARPPLAACRRWQTCVPENPCHTGWVTGCRAGVPICTDIGGWLSNGTSCGTAGVCYMGECTPCAAGEACQPTDPWNNPLICRAGAIQCSTGQPVCVDAGQAPDGAACWPGSNPPYICDGGQCTWCSEGSSCSLPDAPCHVGAMSCSAGSDCVDTGALQPDGTWCGFGQVCSSGACVACEAGASCVLEGMPCWAGAIDCSTGSPVCAPEWPQLPGTPCGDGLVCDGGGGCVMPCSPGASCSTGNPCETGAMYCSSATSGWCQPTGPVPDGTDCGGDAVCLGGTCQYCGPTVSCPSPTPCRPFATISCQTGACVPSDQIAPDGTSCGMGGETCVAGACTGIPGSAIVVRALPGPSTDLTGTTWSLCEADSPLPGQSQRRGETYGIGTMTHVEDTYLSSTTCDGEPDPTQHWELVAQVVTLGDRLAGWDGTPPAGLPAQVTATAAEVSGTWPGTGEAFTFRTLRFVDGQVFPRRIYEGKEPLAPDGVPTSLVTNPRLEVVVPAFTRADLTGGWDVVMFITNPAAAWVYFHATLDPTGQLTLLAWLDSTGSTSVPPGFDLHATIDGAGTVLLSGAYTGTAFHGSMTATKTLIFATDQKGDPGAEERHLWVWRKRVPGVDYAPEDLASASFASHAIYSGSTFRWEYGAGFTDASGAFTMTDLLDSQGGTTAPGLIGTFDVDTAGVVTMAGSDLRGVVAPDRNSVFIVHTTGDVLAPAPALHVLQRTGQSFVQADLAGDYAFHGVTSGLGTSDSFWNHGTATVDASGLVTFTSYLGSGGSTALPPSRTYTLSAGGVLTQATSANFHGQLSWEKDFYVRTSGTASAPYLAFVAR